EATADRQPLVDLDIRSKAAARPLLQQPRRPHAEIVVFRYTRQLDGTADQSVIAQRYSQNVAVVQQLEDSLQQMITVGATTADMQEQVKLGRRRPFSRYHGFNVHS